ncbi:hypothetical protein GCM10023205_00660 [Yinghuangia aomiensis]|uniref:histidine kinase n=1 Tax=Yinghuangia aomiensis TaxID=676205 RepID=A0ABP9GS19_9ACTN
MLPLADPPAEPPAAEWAMPGSRIAPMSGAAIATATAAAMLGLTAAILSVLTLHSDGANLHAGIVALFYLPSGIVGVISARLQHRFVGARFAALQAEIARRADGQRRLADEIERRGTEIAELKRSRQLLLAEDDLLRERMQESFVNLSMRTLTLVERQLSLIERLERGEEDAKRLDDLFRLDHLATRMRRNSENVLVLANADERHGHRPPGTLLDVVRAAVSEIEFYERVDIGHIPRADLSGHAADDISHLISELLENAVEYSPPSTRVTVAARTLENRGILLTVEDEGFGVPPERLPELNAQLQGGRAAASASDLAGLGVFVVGTLAVRHGVRVQLRPRRDGGLAAIVMLPAGLVHGTGPSPTEISHEKDRGRRESAGPATPVYGTPVVRTPTQGTRTGTPAHGVPVVETPAQGTSAASAEETPAEGAPAVGDSRLGAAAAATAEGAGTDRTADAPTSRAPGEAPPSGAGATPPGATASGLPRRVPKAAPTPRQRAGEPTGPGGGGRGTVPRDVSERIADAGRDSTASGHHPAAAQTDHVTAQGPDPSEPHAAAARAAAAESPAETPKTRRRAASDAVSALSDAAAPAAALPHRRPPGAAAEQASPDPLSHPAAAGSEDTHAADRGAEPAHSPTWQSGAAAAQRGASPGAASGDDGTSASVGSTPPLPSRATVRPTAATPSGLPKRVPKGGASDAAPASGLRENGPIAAEELRRRLSGFQLGSTAAREALGAEGPPEPSAPSGSADSGQSAGPASGPPSAAPASGGDTR